MKRTIIITAIMAGLSGYAWSAITLQMSSTSNFATNFGSKTYNAGTGAWADAPANSKMVWGIVVDTDGSGFAGNNPMTPYFKDFSLTASSTPIALSVTTDGINKVATTNKLYISSNIMNLTTNANDAGAIGINRITNLTGVSYVDGVSQDDAFMVVWFNVTAFGALPAPGDTSTQTHYGMTDVPGSAFRKMPVDNNSSHNFAAGWAGAEPLQPMNMVLGVPVPEPSVALLGGLGLLGLLRRRR